MLVINNLSDYGILLFLSQENNRTLEETMKLLKITYALLLSISLSSCLESTPENSAKAFYSVKVNSVEFYVNGVLQAGPEYSVNVGDVISIKVVATDPKALPLQYKFSIFHQCTLSQVLQDFGASNELASYIVTNADVNSCNSISIGIKNNDGINYNSDFAGDLHLNIPFTATNGTTAPTVSSVDVYVNSILQTELPIKARVGDIISLSVNANDPNSLPLEYNFLSSNKNGVSIIQSFSSSNYLASYVITSADIKSGSGLIVGVQNNDGTTYESDLFGDLQFHIQLNVIDSSAPPSISSIKVLVNGVNYPSSDIIYAHVGDNISLQVNAIDPNSLPLEYKFNSIHNCTLDKVLQDFSMSNQLSSYTVTSADINSCNGIGIGLRNNDGIDYDSEFLGDLQRTIQLIVIP